MSKPSYRHMMIRSYRYPCGDQRRNRSPEVTHDYCEPRVTHTYFTNGYWCLLVLSVKLDAHRAYLMNTDCNYLLNISCLSFTFWYVLFSVTPMDLWRNNYTSHLRCSAEGKPSIRVMINNMSLLRHKTINKLFNFLVWLRVTDWPRRPVKLWRPIWPMTHSHISCLFSDT